MKKTFLVAIDFSAVTNDVVDAAVSFASAFKGHVILLHVIHRPLDISAGNALLENNPEDVIRANAVAARLRDIEKLFEQASLPCRTSVKVGVPVISILDEIKSSKADYVVMGSHGHGRIYDALVGSTVGGVIKKTACCVILVPPEGRAYS